MLIVALFRFIRTELFVLLPIIYIMVTKDVYHIQPEKRKTTGYVQ
ncbi:hypothetical protein J2W44_005244 [Priestia aryabhattai]|jgi:hypothetical protein|nr:hypothetical protein [Bacillus sp. PvP124]MDP9579419.1 hypothetical protein [Bacillus sp. 1751]MDP9726135.1 hypothetical protein [Priestia aryabhattai]